MVQRKVFLPNEVKKNGFGDSNKTSAVRSDNTTKDFIMTRLGRFEEVGDSTQKECSKQKGSKHQGRGGSNKILQRLGHSACIDEEFVPGGRKDTSREPPHSIGSRGHVRVVSNLISATSLLESMVIWTLFSRRGSYQSVAEYSVGGASRRRSARDSM